MGGFKAFIGVTTVQSISFSSLQIGKWAIITGPAYKVTVRIPFTYGDLEKDLELRALSDEDRLVLGLCIIGEMQGGMFYHSYPGDTVFGRIVGLQQSTSPKSHRTIRSRDGSMMD